MRGRQRSLRLGGRRENAVYLSYPLPKPGLLYAQVVKSYRRRRIIRVAHRVVLGTREAIEQRLVTRGWKINTSFVERLNLDVRQHVAAIGRRVNTLCKHEAG
jgi:hypothetical protein